MINHQTTQERIMKDVTKAIATNSCPKCNSKLSELLVYVNDSDIVESCEMECPSCHWSVGFGPVLSKSDQLEFSGCSAVN